MQPHPLLDALYAKYGGPPSADHDPYVNCRNEARQGNRDASRDRGILDMARSLPDAAEAELEQRAAQNEREARTRQNARGGS